ncbi:hypothetical protein D6817_02790 [Candidatus Pacearchaeota archaeon]|nr:MAG: hypothetical protein D6817_02790 [Candidatus Pacearchaeota archaeon]
MGLESLLGGGFGRKARGLAAAALIAVPACIYTPAPNQNPQPTPAQNANANDNDNTSSSAPSSSTPNFSNDSSGSSGSGTIGFPPINSPGNTPSSPPSNPSPPSSPSSNNPEVTYSNIPPGLYVSRCEGIGQRYIIHNGTRQLVEEINPACGSDFEFGTDGCLYESPANRSCLGRGSTIFFEGQGNGHVSVSDFDVLNGGDVLRLYLEGTDPMGNHVTATWSFTYNKFDGTILYDSTTRWTSPEDSGEGMEVTVSDTLERQ